MAQTPHSRSRPPVASDERAVTSLADASAELLRDVVRKAFHRNRDVLVTEIVRKVRAAGLGATPGSEPAAAGGEWIGIESLSRLRHVVGGRFHNLREKWVNAGFPLREHRGDKEKAFKISESGWIELSNWILKQGYESRLTPESEANLFELRAVSRPE